MNDALGALKALIVHTPQEPEAAGPKFGSGGSMALLAPKRLRPKHRQVIMLHELGYDNIEIAQMVGYSISRVSVILQWEGPEVEEYRKLALSKVIDRTAEVGDRIAMHAGEMVDIMVRHARNEKDAANSRLAAKDLLHMAGYSPVKKTANLNVNATVPPELQGAVEQLDKFREVKEKENTWRINNNPPPPQLKDGTNG